MNHNEVISIASAVTEAVIEKVSKSAAEMRCNASTTQAQAATDIEFSMICAKKPDRLSKSYSLDSKGVLVKKPGGHLVDGTLKSMKVSNLTAFSQALDAADASTAFVYGTTRYQQADVTTRANLEKEKKDRAAGGLPVIARDREHFSFNKGPGILMLDFDPYPGEAALQPDELRKILYSIWPQLEYAPHLWRPSSSSFIFNQESGAEIRGLAGQRIYIVVANASEIPRIGEVLIKRLWQAGHGRIVFSKSGAMLERTIIDGSVWQPERLDFCGGAHCVNPLTQQKTASILWNPDAPPIDPATLPDLSEKECDSVKEMIRTAKGLDAVTTKSKEITNQWVEARVTETLKKHPKKSAATLRKAFERAAQDHELAGDFPIKLSSGQTKTVDEMLANPDQYDGQRCADPLEPDYGNDTRIALINLKATSPYIYSHAHGGIRYRLRVRPKDILIVGGGIHQTVSEVLDVLRKQETIFERGGDMVRVTQSGQVFPVDADWLSVYLTKIVGFIQVNKKGEAFPVDCPLDTAKRVLAMRGEWNLPHLDAVVTAPIITMDGRILDEPGYDPGTKLLFLLDKHRQKRIPRAPTQEQVVDALNFLWHPFKDFPFVSLTDQSVLLSALLTAVVRPLLPTAPAYLLAAPTAGSGKTLLIKCIASLMGEGMPSMMPPTNNEEEIRKRVMAALREGKSTLVFDNVVGHFDSATLCALLTAPIYSDRVLGASLNVTVTTNALFMASGNNVLLVGDLNRRFLTCTIDPRTDKAYRRTFAMNPAEYVRQNRQEMVAAALTILQAYRTMGAPQAPDRTASFEEWSDTVRQAVMWVGKQTGRVFPDPCDSIDESYDQDPEARKLQALLEAWYKNFGTQNIRVQDVIRKLPNSGYYSCSGPEAELFDAVDEIGGERGNINPRRLGRWIEKMKNRICAGKKFVLGPRIGGSNTWSVQKAG
jgi:hypothetical protein